MNTQPINNISFGTKVLIMPNANKIMENYCSPTEKRSITRCINKFEKTNTNDVIVLDSGIHNPNNVLMSCYKMVNNRLFKSYYSIVASIHDAKSWSREVYPEIIIKNRFLPVKKSCFDKHNPVLDIIKNACKPD